MHKDRGDKLKSTTKSTTSTTNGSSKEGATAVKRKIAKENGVHSIEEKKSEKKHTSVSKSNANANSEKKHESKTNVDSKSVAIRNGKTVQKVPSTERSDKKLEKKPDKKVSSIEKRDQKRPKDKLSSSSDRNSSEAKTLKASKSSESSSSKTKTVSKRQAPLKASHAIAKSSVAATTAVVTTAAAAAVSTKNVMNQVHNVTVLSPPPVRRESVPMEVEIEEPRTQEVTRSALPRGRTRTRTLDANEIVLLKAKPTVVELPTSNAIATATSRTETVSEPNRNDSVMVEIKPPISFEVLLKNETKSKPPEIKVEKVAEKLVENGIKTKKNDKIDDRPKTTVSVDKNDKEPDDYEDDFESYESDFETDISNEDDEDDESEEETSISTGESESDDNVVSTASRHPFETGHSIENSEFDSGSFELKVLSARSRVQNGLESAAASRHDHQMEMQNDSGIENTVVGNALIPTHNGQMNSLDLNNKTFDNISDIENEGINSLDTNNSNKTSSGKTSKSKPKSRAAKRGEELLSKITLDVMNYVLFDSKPIPYELFMKIYGGGNTTQVAVQTHNDRHDQECQSDAITTQTSWSQYPITYYTEHMSRSDFDDYKNGCGSVIVEQRIDKFNENLNRTCENSLSLIRNMSLKMNATEDEMDNSTKLNIDYSHLNRFLLESEMTLSRILNMHIQKKYRGLKKPILPISNGYFTIKPSFGTSFANERVQRIFAIDSLPGFLLTLHSDNASSLNVIALWNLSKLSEPVCLLSAWSKILCVEIHPKIRDIVFAGLDDG